MCSKFVLINLAELINNGYDRVEFRSQYFILLLVCRSYLVFLRSSQKSAGIEVPIENQRNKRFRRSGRSVGNAQGKTPRLHHSYSYYFNIPVSACAPGAKEVPIELNDFGGFFFFFV